MAALLSDQIDRLTQKTRSIKATASTIASTTSNNRPFTNAVLYADLGLLIRDIDPTELGLFTLDQSSAPKAYHTGPPTTQLKPVSFVGATPLRRNPARREDRNQEPEPENYVRAALKCLLTYQDIRPMPRAQAQLANILSELEVARKNISVLHASLAAQQPDEPLEAPSSKLQYKLEDERIKSLQARMQELNQRKKQLTADTKSTAASKQPDSPKLALPNSPDRFWGTPSVDPSRSTKFSGNLLLDEKADFNDLSDVSFSMPTPQKQSSTAPFSMFTTQSAVVESSEEDQPPDESFSTIQASSIRADVGTICPVEDDITVAQPSEAKDPALPEPESEIVPHEKSDHIRITPEVDRITSKILSTYSDILQLPKLSSAKEIIARVKDIANQTPSPDSPSQSSLSAGVGGNAPTGQQILTAHLLYELLSAPQHSMHQNKVKETLTERTKFGMSVGALGQNPTRILYACMAKRLVKIDRSGGEQIVRFDI
ncbi:hypothetical protein FA15DRAFT_674915 [Coprinopsis marcescibilis]|uniref:Uncharacterized protein n=1 Tax=Coprinopsis marcescibilis TaxID=230819 RepID=A0A5C3KFT8_COPMA|nr:hypothetical protein FA15DRAFT_674915 [Coprinopsis marcescibilis]